MASLLDLALVYGWPPILEPPGFPTGVENMRGALQNLIHGWGYGELKMLSKNTCEGVNLMVKLPAKSLQACKFTKKLNFTHIFQGF